MACQAYDIENSSQNKLAVVYAYRLLTHKTKSSLSDSCVLEQL